MLPPCIGTWAIAGCQKVRERGWCPKWLGYIGKDVNTELLIRIETKAHRVAIGELLLGLKEILKVDLDVPSFWECEFVVEDASRRHVLIFQKEATVRVAAWNGEVAQRGGRGPFWHELPLSSTPLFLNEGPPAQAIGEVGSSRDCYHPLRRGDQQRGCHKQSGYKYLEEPARQVERGGSWWVGGSLKGTKQITILSDGQLGFLRSYTIPCT